MSEAGSVGRASSSVAQSSAATLAAIEQVANDDDVMESTLSKHVGLLSDLEASEKLIYQLKQQAAIDLRYRNIGLTVLGLVVAFIVYERVFLNLGGALVVRSALSLSSMAFCSIATCLLSAPAPDATPSASEVSLPSLLPFHAEMVSLELDAATADQIQSMPSTPPRKAHGSAADWPATGIMASDAAVGSGMVGPASSTATD